MDGPTSTKIRLLLQTFLNDAKEVGSATKTAEFCADLAKKAIISAEEKYGCTVIGFVSDNEAKMVKVRDILTGWRCGLVVIGCSSHFLNLVSTAATPAQFKAHVVEVQKYFRSHHRVHALLKEQGGKEPQLPNDTR